MANIFENWGLNLRNKSINSTNLDFLLSSSSFSCEEAPLKYSIVKVKLYVH